jgi:hypothetical protein
MLARPICRIMGPERSPQRERRELCPAGGSKGGREMSRRLYTPEQIIGKLREAEVAGIGGRKSP